jgi:ATP-binding cassette subfamily C protein CydC
MSAPAEAASWRDLLEVYALWRRQAFWLGLGLAISLLAVASLVGLMTFSARTLATALAAGILVAPVLLRLLGLARTVLRYFERLVTHEATFRALADLRVWFFRGLARHSAGGLGFRRSGDVLSRLVNDVEALDGLYLRITVPGVAALILLAALPFLLAPYGFWLDAGVTLLFAAAAIMAPLAAAGQAMRGASLAAETASSLRVAVLDLVGGMREARAFGAEPVLTAEIARREAAHHHAQAALAHRGARAQAGAFLLAQAALLLTVLLTLTQGHASPVAATSIVFLVVAVFEAVSLLPRAGALAGHAASSARRVTEAAGGADPAPAAAALLPSSTALRFDQVSFGWAPDRPPVFQGLSLDIPRGARVAVLGPSGAGKSTLAALALQVAHPWSGRVLLAGADTAAMRADDVRARFSWLSQATHLFNDTVRANLKLARPDADDASLWAALDAAQIGDVVRGLPDGLDTWLGENGGTLSGGQARRLALARALLSPAPILILDEPCAGLDAQTEQDFMTTLNEVAAGRSVLLIAHRLTGVERLDRVYRLSAGHAVAAAA